MKTITIGRGEGCDILIDDYRISRRHAVLKVYTFGKMEIVDMGQNGTWVNGVKLRPGVPFPVKRKDVVNFANASQLNWALVDNPIKYIKFAGIIAVGLLLLGLLIAWVSNTLSQSSSQMDSSFDNNVNTGFFTGQGEDVVVDSVSAKDSSKVKDPNTEVRKKKGKSAPKTIQELFPQKPTPRKENPKAKKEEKNKNKKSKKATDSKKTDKDSPIYQIL